MRNFKIYSVFSVDGYVDIIYKNYTRIMKKSLKFKLFAKVGTYCSNCISEVWTFRYVRMFECSIDFLKLRNNLYNKYTSYVCSLIHFYLYTHLSDQDVEHLHHPRKLPCAHYN